MNGDIVDWTIIGPAVLAGMLVLSTHVPLGQVVLKRGIIFIDLAIAQIAALGVIAAGYFGWQENPYAVQVAAVGAALLAAAFLNWTDKHWPRSQEALIGTLFVLAGNLFVLKTRLSGKQPAVVNATIELDGVDVRQYPLTE